MCKAPKNERGAAPSPSIPYTAFCGCGYARPVPPSEKDTTPPCPGCGKIMVVQNAPPPPKIQKFERIKPSAPLLPLHMRAPLRAKVKAGAQFFDCVCGERLLIRAGASGRPIQCPACDRFHILEQQEAPPPGPAPVPGAKPKSAPAAPPRPLGLGEFLCKCGEIQPPRTSRSGKEFECKKCGRKGRVEMDRDPQSGAVKMRPVFTSEPTVDPRKSLAAETQASASVSPAWTCTCGRAIEAHLVLASKETKCLGCGRTVKLEKWRHPHSTMTMIRPIFGEPAAAPKGGDPVVAFEELESLDPYSEAAVFELAAGSEEGDAPPSVSSDVQVAPCECGAEILLSPKDAGQTIQCPACADLMTVVLKGTALTLKTLGEEIDHTNWTLDEFR